VCICVFTHKHTHTHIYIQIGIYIVDIYMFVCMYVYIHMHTYIPITACGHCIICIYVCICNRISYIFSIIAPRSHRWWPLSSRTRNWPLAWLWLWAIIYDSYLRLYYIPSILAPPLSYRCFPLRSRTCSWLRAWLWSWVIIYDVYVYVYNTYKLYPLIPRAFSLVFRIGVKARWQEPAANRAPGVSLRPLYTMYMYLYIKRIYCVDTSFRAPSLSCRYWSSTARTRSSPRAWRQSLAILYDVYVYVTIYNTYILYTILIPRASSFVFRVGIGARWQEPAARRAPGVKSLAIIYDVYVSVYVYVYITDIRYPQSLPLLVLALKLKNPQLAALLASVLDHYIRCICTCIYIYYLYTISPQSSRLLFRIDAGP